MDSPMQYLSHPVLFPDTPTWLPGTRVDLDPATFGKDAFGIKKPNGKFLSVQPDGSYEERDAVGGSYEIFRQDRTLNVVSVTPRYLTYKIAVREQ